MFVTFFRGNAGWTLNIQTMGWKKFWCSNLISYQMCFHIMYIWNNFQAWKSNETLLKTHNIYENVKFLFKKGFTPVWYSIRHCRWVWVIRTTEMHQSSGNGRGPTQYFIIFRPPWLRILHEECPVYLSSQILTEHQRNPEVPWYPPGIVDWQRARIPLRSHVIWQFVTWLPIGGLTHWSQILLEIAIFQIIKKLAIGCLKSSA